MQLGQNRLALDIGAHLRPSVVTYDARSPHEQAIFDPILRSRECIGEAFGVLLNRSIYVMLGYIRPGIRDGRQSSLNHRRQLRDWTEHWPPLRPTVGSGLRCGAPYSRRRLAAVVSAALEDTRPCHERKGRTDGDQDFRESTGQESQQVRGVFYQARLHV